METSSPILDRRQLERQYQRTILFGSLIAIGVFVFLASVSYLAYHQVQQTFVQINQLRFDNEVVGIVNTFQEKFNDYPQAMKSVRGFIIASEIVTGREWQAFIESLELSTTLPGLTSINYGEAIPAEFKQAFEEEVRADTTLTAEIYRTYTIHPETTNTMLYPIEFVAPLLGRENLVGFDRGADLIRARAIEDAINSGEVRASDVTEVVPGQGRGYVLFLAVYEPDLLLQTPQDRRLALRGLVSSQFSLDESFIKFLPENAPLESLDIEVFNQAINEPVNAAKLLYDSNPEILQSARPPVTGIREAAYEISLAGTPWTMRFFSDTKADVVQAGGLTPNLVLISGIIFAFLLSGLVGILVMLRVNAYKIAIDLTEDLEENRRAMSLLISNLPGAAYRHENEPTLRFTYVSNGIQNLTGYTVSEFLEGKIKLADLIISEHRNLVWQTIQTALQDRRPFRLNFALKHKDGNLRWLWGQGEGVFDTADQLKYIEGFLTDITERQLSEEKLAERAQELERLNQILVGRENKMAELKQLLKQTNNHEQ